MIYDVLAQPMQGIDFAPASEVAEILQNLRTIITLGLTQKCWISQ